MDLELIKKVDELLDIFNQNNTIKRIDELKKEIYSDKELKNKLTIFKNSDQYSSNYIELKRDIMNNPKIKEFKKYESDIILLTLSINKKLNSLTRKKGCFYENN